MNQKEQIQFINEKLTTEQPFALSRFADGEELAINGEESSPGMGEWHIENSDSRTANSRKMLLESLQYQHPDYFVGICPCYKELIKMSGQPDNNILYANLFSNSNHSYFIDEIMVTLKSRSVVMVCNKDANIESLPINPIKVHRVNDNAWITDLHMIQEIKSDNLNGAVYLVAAGAFTDILVHHLWQHNQSNTYMDVGSALDPFLGNKHHVRAYYTGHPYYSNLVCPCPNAK